MIDVKDLSYLDVQSRRAELAEAIKGLHDLLDKEPVNKVWVAFLLYEAAVLKVMQEDLSAIDGLIARVQQAEALSGTQIDQDTIDSFKSHRKENHNG